MSPLSVMLCPQVGKSSESTRSQCIRLVSFLLVLASSTADSVDASLPSGNDVCYFGMVHGDSCSISADDSMPEISNPKNATCLASEISSVMQVDIGNLKPKQDTPKTSSRLGAKGRPSGQSDEEQELYQIGDVVEFETFETEPDAMYSFYPCVTRGVLHEEDDAGNPVLRYVVERLIDGVLAAVSKDVLRPYNKYKYGASNVFCRARGTNPISDPNLESPVEFCRVLWDNFPDSDPHTRVESFLSGHYQVVYLDDPSEVHRVSAHDMFLFRYLEEEHETQLGTTRSEV